MLPSYASVMQQQQDQQEPQEPEPELEQDFESEQRQPSFRHSYVGLHQHQQSQLAGDRVTGTTNATSVKDGPMEVNLTFLQGPAGVLLASSSILGLVICICGVMPHWGQSSSAAFCVFSGLLHFAGCSFLFFAYLFNFFGVMPWYSRALAIYYYLVSAGVSLVAFVFSGSRGSMHSAAVAAAVFAFLAMAVDIVLIVLSYTALTLGYSGVQSGRDAAEA